MTYNYINQPQFVVYNSNIAKQMAILLFCKVITNVNVEILVGTSSKSTSMLKKYLQVLRFSNSIENNFFYHAKKIMNYFQ